MTTSVRSKTTITFWLKKMVILLKSWRRNVVVKFSFVSEYFKIFLKTFSLQIFSCFSEELVTRNSLELVTRNSFERVTIISSEWVTRNSSDLVPGNGSREIPGKSCLHFHRIFLWKIPGNFRGFSAKLLLGYLFKSFEKNLFN